MLRSLLRIIVSAMVLMPGLALAHPGHPGDTGFIQGFIHPLNGIDHLLAMVAVGLLAARLGGRALWLVPISFLSMMAVGAILGVLGCAMPFVQIGVAGSVVALGTAAALKRDMPTALAMAVVGAFAIFHGHAHGTELPAMTSALPYAAGFMIATAGLHLFGIAMGRLGMARSELVARFACAAMAVFGIALVGAAL